MSTFAFVLVVAGGFLTGAFAAPMKHARRWRWENIWAAYSLFALVLIPTAVIASVIPNLAGLYASLPPARLAAILSIGLAWGAGCATFGIGIDRLGMGLGFSLIMGISTLLGTVAPLFMGGGLRLSLVPFASGLALLLAGIAVCGVAGNRRERASAANTAKRGYAAGIAICLISGVLSALFNAGMVAGAPLQSLAALSGAPAWASGNAVWPLLLFGGFLANGAYCGWLLSRNGTWGLYFKGGAREWLSVFVMGAAWIGGVLMYGAGAFYMGSLGPVIGWPVFTSLMLICAYLLGRLAGEWRQAAPATLRVMNAGILLIVASLFVIAASR